MLGTTQMFDTSTLDLVKSMVEAGPSVVYLTFLIVMWATGRKDQREARENLAEMVAAGRREMSDMVARYEVLLRESVESLTKVAEALGETEEDDETP